MIFFVLSGKKLFFPESMILFFRWKMKDDISENIHGNMILSLYSVKTVFFSKQIWYYTSVKRQRSSSLEKIHLKITFPVSLEKIIFILENIVFLMTEKLKW